MSEGSGISVLKHVEALFLTHTWSLWVTGSPAGHGELCGSWGALWVMGSPEHHGEPCGSRGALWITGSSAAHGELCSTRPLGALGSFCRQYGTSGCPDPLQPAEKWGNDTALTPINTSPLMAPPEGTGLLATLAGWAGSCD